jgi:hypothetical protein
MAKLIEFYVRDLFPKKVRSAPRDRRGEVIEFPKDKAAVASKTPPEDFDLLTRGARNKIHRSHFGAIEPLHTLPSLR